MEEKKKRPGRPVTVGAAKPIQVYLTLEQHAWLKQHSESASEVLRRLIDEAMGKTETKES